MDLLSNFVEFALLFNIFSAVYMMVYGVVPWEFLLMAGPFFGMYAWRRLVKEIGICIVGHLLFLGPAFFFSGGVFWMVLVFGLAAVFHSVSSALGGERVLKPHGVAVIFLVIVGGLFFGNFAADVWGGYGTGLEVLVGPSVLAVLAASLLYVQMYNLDMEMEVYGVQERATRRANNRLVGVFTSAIVVLSLTAMFVPFGWLLRMIWYWTGRGIGFLWNVLTFPFTFLIREFEPLVEEEMVDAPVVVEQPEIGEGSPVGGMDLNFEWLEWLMEILPWTAVVVVSAGVLYGLFLAVQALYRRFFKGDKRENFDEGVEKVRLEFSLGDLGKGLTAFLARFKSGSKHPVRRAYVRKINGFIRMGAQIEEWHTPEMIAGIVRGVEDIGDLTEIYERVRYGREYS